MKTIGLTALAVADQELRIMFNTLQRYGLTCNGHLWKDDLEAMAWLAPKDDLCQPRIALWAIMGAAEVLHKPETRYGLSLLALCLQAKRGAGFPLVILQSGGETISAEMLPTPLQHAAILPAANAATPAKLVAKAHGRVPDIEKGYYLDMVGNPQFGQWFEVRPAAGVWPGMIFGAEGAQIRFQAVGPAGALPKTSTLHYPMQGLQMGAGGKDYTAWAVRNAITPDDAYYVKVDGAPASILFGPFSEENEAEMYRVQLK